MTTPDNKIADDIISTLEKLRAENPGDFMAVAEMRNEVLEEAARVAEDQAQACSDGASDAGEIWVASKIAERIRAMKSGGKNA
jgi:hypothetical protein